MNNFSLRRIFTFICLINIYAIFFTANDTAYAQQINYATLRQKNGGTEAEEIKMIHTTEPSVCFTFAGLTKPNVVYDILTRLKGMNAKGTFFIMKSDIDKNPQLIQYIINSGNEVGIGLPSLKNTNFDAMCSEINYIQSHLAAMGAKTNVVMQPWGTVTPETREAVSAMGCQLIGPYINIINSKQKKYTNPEDVINEIFGKYMYSMGRGWVIFFRLNYYDDDSLCGKVMELLKRRKIDVVQYVSTNDDPKSNIKNDSAYSINGVIEVLNNTHYRYEFSQKSQIPIQLQDDYNPMIEQKISFNDYIKKRYIGNNEVGPKGDALGFSLAELRNLDTSGRIHTNKPVIFLTFDDWGSDVSINKLLYVLRKHNVKATFCILTNNVTNNPNLLRAIAADGHDIASHSDKHIPMTQRDKTTNRLMPSPQSYNQYINDLKTAYTKLEMITGNVVFNGHPVLTRYFRPPTLYISKMGFKSLYADGYEYIVSGSYSTDDFRQPSLESMISAIKAAIYADGKVIKGAVLVMHMSDYAAYTATALDMILTENDLRKDNDPAKFITSKLSDYLTDNYDQSNFKIK
ncbi:polysaccharide deacetylase family protein [Pectinatus frisingensis]|uniref:polysaccharide deacetylase family protein n=1 Tax=Pectinatus frisingensis TaxID=865 RepID=UPI0018C696E7|nr:polysaccharide deacetylase family protein [Pectinatus frisingensis]